MRVRGDNAPSNAFTVEEQPKKPGFVLVRFYENAEEFEEAQGELTISGWEYDEYLLELEDTGAIEEDVLNNFDMLLAQAKAAEAADEGSGDLEGRMSALEAAQQEVWNVQASAIREGVNCVD